MQVERVRLDAGHVAGASGLDRILIDCLAKLRDRPLDEIRSAGRRLLAPDGIDDARRRYQAAGLGEQNNQHSTLARPTQLDSALVDERYNRSEQPIANSRHHVIVLHGLRRWVSRGGLPAQRTRLWPRGWARLVTCDRRLARGAAGVVAVTGLS
ncbi:MAG TPA: hypothetical protein VES79_01520 [Solirubrobacteraceae bacterium]|nr:hypothetical protein [Solirubrobacteraceae bacterium]